MVQEAQQQHDKNRRDEDGDDDDDDERGNENNDLIEFLMTMQSNERILEWSVMGIDSGCQFKLHAHPNIELVYCLHGELHEVRMDGKPITKTFHPIGTNNNNNNNDETNNKNNNDNDDDDDDDDNDNF